MSKKPVYQGYYEDEATKNLEMGIYAYGPPHGPRFKVEGIRIYSDNPEHDYRTVERYKEYKECGFNMILTQVSGQYFGECAWEESVAKRCMDRYYEAGITKAILLDERIRKLSCEFDGVIGEGKRFASQDELDAWVADCMKDYKHHPAFYGIQFCDEPCWRCFKTFGQIWKAVKKACPEAFIQCNLWGLYFSFRIEYFPPYGKSNTFEGRMKEYLNMFLDETGADYIMLDRYGFFTSEDSGLYPYYFLNNQVINEVMKERGIKKMALCVQSFAQRQNGFQTHRMPTEAEMNFQIHALLGAGVKEFAYYTYWSGGDYSGRGEYRDNDWAIVSTDGQRTYLYPVVQRLNGMIKKLSPVLMNFDHVADTYAVQMPCVSKPMHLQHTRCGKLTHARLKTSQEVAMLFELKDEKRDNWLYVLENVTCPKFGAGLPAQTSTVRFTNPAWTKVDVFDGNEWHTEDLVNGTFTATLNNGDAVYLMPY